MCIRDRSPFVLIKAAAKLIRKLGLSKVGIVSKGVYHDVHYSRMTEAFLHIAQKHDITVEFQMEGDLAKSSLSLRKLRESSAKLIVVFLPPSEAVEIICNSHLQGFTWPHYGWVYVEINSSEVTTSKTTLCSEGMMTGAIENVIFLHLHLWPYREDYVISNTGKNYSTFHTAYLQKLEESSSDECLQSNPYANVLYDSIWALAWALNRSFCKLSPEDYNKTTIEEALTQVSFQGATGYVNFSKIQLQYKSQLAFSKFKKVKPYRWVHMTHLTISYT